MSTFSQNPEPTTFDEITASIPMSAQERLQVMVRTDRGSMTVWSPAEVRDALDAFRAEVQAEDGAVVSSLLSALGDALTDGQSEAIRTAAALISPLLSSRFHATPAEVHAFLAAHLAEDTHLRYQQAIGEEAVREATEDLRAFRHHPDADLMKQAWRTGVDDAIDQIDPDRGGPYPSDLIRLSDAEVRS